MDKGALWSVLKEQLTLDLGCDSGLLDIPDNIVVEWREAPGRRRYGEDRPFLEVIILGGKLIASANEAILPWCRERLLHREAQWLFRPGPFRALENMLAEHGYEIGNFHHYYLPKSPFPMVTPRFLVRWHEGEALERFRGDNRWREALAFNPHSPDMLAVTAMDRDCRPIGMAACSRDGARLWQIGVDVLPDYRGLGIASNLTGLLAQELLRRGIVPFYGTAESHILSQNVAINAGFRPAFAYLYAQRVPQG